MVGDPATAFRARARHALMAAMKARDTVAAAALRSVLAEIDQAEAVDAAQAPRAESGRIAGGVAGLGAGEVPRHDLGDDEVGAVLDRAIAEREEAAAHYLELHRPEDARRLQAEIAVLNRLRDPDEGAT